MLVPTVFYGVAAASDIRWRRVPDVLWVVVAGYAIVTGVPWQAFAAAAYLGVAGYWAFRTGEFGGGDVKAITVLPLAFPLWWPAAITVSLVVAAVGLRAREEIPFVVAIFVGVVTSLAVS